jgi:hypothetical protein
MAIEKSTSEHKNYITFTLKPWLRGPGRISEITVGEVELTLKKGARVYHIPYTTVSQAEIWKRHPDVPRYRPIAQPGGPPPHDATPIKLYTQDGKFVIPHNTLGSLYTHELRLLPELRKHIIFKDMYTKPLFMLGPKWLETILKPLPFWPLLPALVVMGLGGLWGFVFFWSVAAILCVLIFVWRPVPLHEDK